MRPAYVIFLILLMGGNIFSETWGKLIQFGTGVFVHSIRRTQNGGVILGVSNRFTVKLDRSGQIEWQKAGMTQAIETLDGGFAGIGSNQGRWFLAKFNRSQTMQWQRSYNFASTGNVVFTQLRAVGGLGYVLVGIEFSRTEPRKCLLLRTDSGGNPLWLRKYPAFNLLDMEIVNNQSFILVGRPNVTILQVSINGDMFFKGRFGTGSEDAVSIQPTLDGNFIVASNRRITPLLSFLTKISTTNRRILWRQSFASQPRMLFSSVRSIQGGYLVAGIRRAPNQPNQNLFIMRFGTNGVFQWDNFFGEFASEYGYAIATLDNHFAIAGSTSTVTSGNESGFVLKFPRNVNAGSFCDFYKNYEQPFTQQRIVPPPPINLIAQAFEDADVTSENSTVEISDGNLEISDLCNSVNN
jgi:hypothetical protein